ncbi:MAG: ATP-binding cassette domain-containing protein [Clostridiales bacterium]|jgi:oligopeptide/dipeptide ABC transporter ATP-binding protein|nr:ATP-binding cassette domain-containing protein [Clostridiales bacterium]
MPGDSAEDILTLRNVCKYYKDRKGSGHLLKAVDGVSFSVRRGETFGLVGESGCGKSTLSRVILQLEPVSGGSVAFEGRDFARIGRRELRAMRKEMQIVFQDPYDSIDPRMTLEQAVEEPMAIHRYDRSLRKTRIKKLFEDVGLPVNMLNRYPHQLSGGQRQRLCIARSLALSPKLLVCDEAVSALDVSIQAQILNLMCDLKEEHNLTYIFISHNLGVIKFISDRIAVMYFGKIVELASRNEIFTHYLHPYTCALLSAAPVLHPSMRRERMLLTGDVPNLYNPPAGCVFCDRCVYADSRCRSEAPVLRGYGEDRQAACHYAGELPLKVNWGGAPC